MYPDVYSFSAAANVFLADNRSFLVPSFSSSYFRTLLFIRLRIIQVIKCLLY